MSLIQKVRSKSAKEKIRIIWTIVGVVFLLLVIFWIAIGNYNYGNVNKDTTILKTLEKGINDFKNKPPQQ